MNKKVLITGASGYLANALVPCVAERAQVIGVARNANAIVGDAQALSLDVTDKDAVLELVLSQQPDAIIHCAACNPGGSDEDMYAVNELGTANIAQAVRQLGCRLVSVSSDTVLNGVDAPFADDAKASPLQANAYAVSKALGEEQIRTLVPSAVIVRTSLIYGTDQIDRGTAGFADRLAAGETLKLFTDVIRQPVHDKALAESLCALAMDYTDESGVMNVAGDDAISRYDFGVQMLEFWGIDCKDQLEASSGVGIEGLPLNLELTMTRAHGLGLPTPGLSKILAAAV